MFFNKTILKKFIKQQTNLLSTQNKALTKYQVITPDTTTLMNVPARKPINEPIADFKANPVSFPPINSPIKAPKNGPIIIPKGGKKNIPNIKPIVLPHTPFFVPPNCFVPHNGII